MIKVSYYSPLPSQRSNERRRKGYLDARGAEKKIEKLNTLLSSEKAFGTDMDPRTYSRYMNERAKLNRLESWAKNASAITSGRVKASGDAIEELRCIAEKISKDASTCTGVGSKSFDSLNLKKSAEEALNSVQNILNRRHDDEYLFSGTIDSAPVKDIRAKHYYSGNSMADSFSRSDGSTVEYGTTGNAEGIAKLIDGLKAVINAQGDVKSGDAPDIDKIRIGKNLLSDSVKLILQYESKAGRGARELESAISRAKNEAAEKSRIIDEIAGLSLEKKADMFRQLSEEQSKLQLIHELNNRTQEYNQKYRRTILGLN